MQYIALLRGINISGKNKISMNELKSILEENKYENVSTYLNSGNLIFESPIKSKEIISKNIELIIKNNFNLDIPVFIMTKDELKDILDNSPTWWGNNNPEIYDNLIFIFPNTSYEDVYDSLKEPSHDIEKIYVHKNSIFWSYQLKYYQKSNWWKRTASTKIKDKITIRTSKTVRKIFEKASLK